MTNIKSLIRKLRNAADTLEELFMFKENETSDTIRKMIIDRKIPITKKKKLHWTQRPENKAKVEQWKRKMNRNRK